MSIAAIKMLAHSIGATVEEDEGGRHKCYQIIAPHGHVWRSGSKCLRVDWIFGVPADRAAALKDAAERIRVGVRPMTKEEAFVCDEQI